MSDRRGWLRRYFQNISGTALIAAADDDTTLVSSKLGHTIFLQRLVAYITTDAAVSWSFEDSNGTPRKVGDVPASPGAGSIFTFDFGDEGIALTEAKNLVLNVSAAGLAGTVVWEGYLKQTSTLSASQLASA